MLRNRIRIMKFTCFIFAAVWIIHIIISFIKYYKDAQNLFQPNIFSASILGFWMGIISALIISGSYSILFWSSYRAKYKNEKIFNLMPKKIVAFLLAMMIFRLTFQLSIFKPALFFTLLIFIKNSEKEQLESKAGNEI